MKSDYSDQLFKNATKASTYFISRNGQKCESALGKTSGRDQTGVSTRHWKRYFCFVLLSALVVEKEPLYALLVATSARLSRRAETGAAIIAAIAGTAASGRSTAPCPRRSFGTLHRHSEIVGTKAKEISIKRGLTCPSNCFVDSIHGRNDRARDRIHHANLVHVGLNHGRVLYSL